MFVTFLLFFLGFYVLIKGAKFLVDGSSSLAQRFNISHFVIGLVVAGIGTSIPEFATSFIAHIFGAGDISLGIIIGSNTFNILFILGISSLFFPLTFKKEWVDRDLIWNILAVLLVVSFAIPFGDGVISRPEGFFMLVLFAGWLYVVIRNSNSEVGEEPIRIFTVPLAAGLIIAGFIGVLLGGKWVVDGAVVIAQELGMSGALIGLTIVGIGTSLPELAVSFVAAYKKQSGIALGNIVGSNIFDFLMILGVSALVKPILFPPHLFFDSIVTILAAGALYGFMFMGARYTLKRWQGFVLILLYILYVVFLMGGR